MSDTFLRSSFSLEKVSVTSPKTGVTQVFTHTKTVYDSEGDVQAYIFTTADLRFELHVLND